ncbi:DUF1786 domain-containing protein [Methanobrevibacter sp. DSM 116169]|uniref:DUF1786 domain-containing protein n=1 Tax=Methanobrevibacter sp. DSM 116169 TaxID=3242727 RepID=UPI0038FCB1C4
MKILAIDIGTGTQDILFYDTTKELENSIKLVLPSPHIFIGQKIDQIENNILFTGNIMGGGKLKKKILEHIDKGYEVVMEEKCAKTIRDNLEHVKDLGIKIKDDNKNYDSYTKIYLSDVDMKKLKETFLNYDLDFEIDKIAIAVQDHGYNEKMGDRDFRFEKIREKIKFPINVEEFGYIDNIPEYFSRMKSVESTIKNEEKLTPLLMDTKFASICGMCYDENIKNLNSFIVIDIGNGHTTAASIENNKIQGIFEHHTSSLTKDSLEKYITKLASGKITNEEVYNDHGHGAHVINPISTIEKVVVSGPRRELIESTHLDWYYSCPGGDVMMTGTIGLIKTLEYLSKR